MNVTNTVAASMECETQDDVAVTMEDLDKHLEVDEFGFDKDVNLLVDTEGKSPDE